jgi:hemerythrin-like domain-containing protein
MKTALPKPEVEHLLPRAASPTDVLREEHEVILRALAVLEHYGRELAQGKPVKAGTIEWLANFFKTFADRCHHAKEEQHLFPALEQHGVPKEGGPLGVMLEEHEEGRALVRTFAQAEPKAAAAILRFVTLLREHIVKENDILFPLSDQVLPAPEQQAMMVAFEASEREIAGPEVHRRLLEGLARLESESSSPMQ